MSIKKLFVGVAAGAVILGSTALPVFANGVNELNGANNDEQLDCVNNGNNGDNVQDGPTDNGAQDADEDCPAVQL